MNQLVSRSLKIIKSIKEAVHSCSVLGDESEKFYLDENINHCNSPIGHGSRKHGKKDFRRNQALDYVKWNLTKSIISLKQIVTINTLVNGFQQNIQKKIITIVHQTFQHSMTCFKNLLLILKLRK
jgi:hypothetical protein